MRKFGIAWGLPVVLLAALACSRQGVVSTPWNPSFLDKVNASCPAGVDAAGYCLKTPTPTLPWYIPATRSPGDPILTPTPDPPRPVPTLRQHPEEYTVQPGDNLAIIGDRYSVGYVEIARFNQIENPDNVSAGQKLLIPAPTPAGKTPAFKIIPDSELFYSPYSITLDVSAFVQEHGGYLSGYTEEVNGDTLSGAQIIQLVAEDFSVNPRLLLAVLEYSGGWVRSTQVDQFHQDYPLGFEYVSRRGLYKQISFAANQLNRGFYLWQINAVPAWILADGAIYPVNDTVNAGTAAVHQLAASLYPQDDWLISIGQEGIAKTYTELFGYPFDNALYNLVPPDLVQPEFQLPFEPGVTWSYTGGPHPGFGEGSAWAALDFAPPGDLPACAESDAWVTAIAGGIVTRSAHGAVVIDQDQDGNVQTGWSVLYLHLSSRDRIPAGSVVSPGDRLGHPSCEGGVSSGTHVHIARRYNGMWISADGSLPFVLDGWISSGDGQIYNGFLEKDDRSIEAWNGKRDENQIQR